MPVIVVDMGDGAETVDVPYEDLGQSYLEDLAMGGDQEAIAALNARDEAADQPPRKGKRFRGTQDALTEQRNRFR